MLLLCTFHASCFTVTSLQIKGRHEQLLSLLSPPRHSNQFRFALVTAATARSLSFPKANDEKSGVMRCGRSCQS